MVPQAQLEAPEIAEAVQALTTTSQTSADLEQYEKYWDVFVNIKNQ